MNSNPIKASKKTSKHERKEQIEQVRSSRHRCRRRCSSGRLGRTGHIRHANGRDDADALLGEDIHEQRARAVVPARLKGGLVVLVFPHAVEVRVK